MSGDPSKFDWSFASLKTLMIVVSVAVVVIFVVLGTANLSSTETVLLGVVQTFFSLLVGWVITHEYAKRSEAKAVRDIEELHQKNLRTYALKAAEKVENLSRELSRLGVYLNQELDETDYGSPDEELSAKEERIQSAIHILNTLKSVNDTSLSDWRGVIGDEIEEIRLRAEQREETLEKLVDRIQKLEAQDQGAGQIADPQLLREIDKLRRDMRFLAGDVVGNLWSAKKPVAGARHTFGVECPACGGQFSVRQKVKEGSTKGVTCKSCSSRLVSRIQDGRPVLRLRRAQQELVVCVFCEMSSSVSLDELVGANVPFECASCGRRCRATRSAGGVVVTSNQERLVLSDELISRVREKLPAQPWPKGVHLQVAAELGVTANTVQKVIQRLIATGVFMDQFNGRLCTTDEKTLLMRAEAGGEQGA